AIASPLICSRTAPTSEPSRSSWAIAASAPRRGTSTWPPRPCDRPAAPWTAWTCPQGRSLSHDATSAHRGRGHPELSRRIPGNVRLEADARATPCPQRPGLLPHGGPGWSRPGVPRVRASADRLQLLRQSPLPHLPGYGRGTVAGEAGGPPSAHAVLPCRFYTPGCPRPDRTGQFAGRLRPALAVRRRDLARGGRCSETPGSPDRRLGRAAHLWLESSVTHARSLRRA